VAIITGRAVEDIRARLPFVPDFLVGNHGIEGVPGLPDRRAGYRQLWKHWERTLAAALQDRTRFDGGIWIEQKTYSLSVHFRLARDQDKAQAALYVGDDVTDEDVFRLQRSDWLTVRIGRSSDTAAEFFLHHRLDIITLLDMLIRVMSQPDRGLADTRPASAVS
jgi:trehalose 6-phosphate phosphatase